MKRAAMVLIAAALAGGLISAASVPAGAAAKGHHHARRHRHMGHRAMTTGHATMAMTTSRRRTASATRPTPRHLTDGHGPTRPRTGHGVYGGVFSPPTVTNNGQAAPGAR